MKTLKLDKKNKILVTSALPYANGSIHIGHLVEYIQTDIYTRFLKLLGLDAIYCCADDAHGAPIEIKASQLKKDPEELIADVWKEHTQDFKRFLIEFDNYHSTHSEENKEISTEIYNRLKKNGHIYTKDLETTFCENCKRFLPDRYVKGKCPSCGAEDQYGDVCERCNSTHNTVDLVEPYCTICKTAPIRKNSKHYFFKLSDFASRLQAWFEKADLQDEVKNYLNNWIKEGLEDWCISRDGPYFGFKIPDEEDKYFYVWLDAPIGYFASCKNYCDKNNLDSDDYFFGKDSKIIHFIGKDIIYFHFLFWPATLMGADFNLPTTLNVHGFLTVNREKMSKSRGTFLTAKEFADKYDPEYLRYYYAKVLSRKLADIDLDFEDFYKTINNELVANLGNLCYRTISFVNKHFNGEIKNIPDEHKLIGEIKEKFDEIKESYETINFNKATKAIMAIGSLGNKYFQDKEPWVLVKEGKLEEARQVCALCVNIVKNLCVLVKPILPRFSEELEKQLNLEKLNWDSLGFDLENFKVGIGEILIQKIDIKKIQEEEKKKQVRAAEKDNAHNKKDDQKKDQKKDQMYANLKVAEILEAKLHPNSDKLIIMQIGLGKDKVGNVDHRQIVAGIQGWYKPEDLIGKRIIVVSNLRKAKLGGEESFGMLLAADDGDNVRILPVKDSGPGDQVYIDKYKSKIKEGRITIDEFLETTKLVTKDNKILLDGQPLITDKETIELDIKDGCKVR